MNFTHNRSLYLTTIYHRYMANTTVFVVSHTLCVAEKKDIFEEYWRLFAAFYTYGGASFAAFCRILPFRICHFPDAFYLLWILSFSFYVILCILWWCKLSILLIGILVEDRTENRLLQTGKLENTAIHFLLLSCRVICRLCRFRWRTHCWLNIDENININCMALLVRHKQ